VFLEELAEVGQLDEEQRELRRREDDGLDERLRVAHVARAALRGVVEGRAVGQRGSARPRQKRRRLSAAAAAAEVRRRGAAARGDAASAAVRRRGGC